MELGDVLPMARPHHAIGNAQRSGPGLEIGSKTSVPNHDQANASFRGQQRRQRFEKKVEAFLCLEAADRTDHIVLVVAAEASPDVNAPPGQAARCVWRRILSP